MNPHLSKASQLRAMLASGDLEFLMEAHNGISSKIVEETGFKGIWASGLSMSAGLGVRDNNEASWTQVLEMLEFMSDATSIPILVDGDTGYGNFNNLRRGLLKFDNCSSYLIFSQLVLGPTIMFADLVFRTKAFFAGQNCSF